MNPFNQEAAKSPSFQVDGTWYRTRFHTHDSIRGRDLNGTERIFNLNRVNAYQHRLGHVVHR